MSRYWDVWNRLWQEYYCLWEIRCNAYGFNIHGTRVVVSYIWHLDMYDQFEINIQLSLQNAILSIFMNWCKSMDLFDLRFWILLKTSHAITSNFCLGYSYSLHKIKRNKYLLWFIHLRHMICVTTTYLGYQIITSNWNEVFIFIWTNCSTYIMLEKWKHGKKPNNFPWWKGSVWECWIRTLETPKCTFSLGIQSHEVSWIFGLRFGISILVQIGPFLNHWNCFEK